MKNLIIFLFILCLTSLANAGIDLPWSTTFDCTGDTDSAWTCDGMQELGSGSETTYFTSSANYSGGDGGNGARFQCSDGDNQGNSQPIGVVFNNLQTELWIRVYIRYESGFNWQTIYTNMYDKLLYLDSAQTGKAIGEWSDGYMAIWDENDSTDKGSISWEDVMGGTTSDGEFHCYEIHLKLDTDGSDGVKELWVDGEKGLTKTDVDFDDNGWNQLHFYSNQKVVDNGSPANVDYDDMAISNTGYIGPLDAEETTTIQGITIY